MKECNDIILAYDKALDDIYDHVGFKEDWVVCPIDICLEHYWKVDVNENEFCIYGTKEAVIEENGDHYKDDIYTQRFYEKYVFRGKKYTMVFCDPNVDGMTWWRIFDNTKEVK